MLFVNLGEGMLTLEEWRHFQKSPNQQGGTKAKGPEALEGPNKKGCTAEEKVLATKARLSILGFVLGGTAVLRSPIGAGGPHFF